MSGLSTVVIEENTVVRGIDEGWFRLIEITSTDPSRRFPMYCQDRTTLMYVHISIETYVNSLFVETESAKGVL